MSLKPPVRKDLWILAFESLSPEDKARLQPYRTEKDPRSIDETLRVLRDKQDLCMQKRWTLKIRGDRRIIIRDVLDKIAFWINKFKETGDVAVQYDPTHAALPWAGVRFLLEVTTNDLQTFAAVAEGLEALARLISRYSIFETAYLPSIGEEVTGAQSKLGDALTTLYSDSLRYLADIGCYYERSTGKRILRSLFELSDRSINPLNAIYTKEAEVEKLAQIVQTERACQLDKSLATFQVNSDSSFESIRTLLNSFKSPILRLSDPLIAFQESLEAKDRRKLLVWLSSDTYSAHHESTYKHIVPGTAQWILSQKSYQEWQVSSACSILWLHGMPGSGKSTLTSVIIQQHLDAAQGNAQSAPVAYFYCSSTKKNTTTLDSGVVLRSIVKQLAIVESGPNQKVRKSLWEEFKRRQEAADLNGLDPSPLTREECTEMLLTMTSDCPATIIIDGLDELDGHRLDLLDTLQTLIDESSSLVKIMISSREDTDIAQGLKGAMSVPVSRSENSTDIEKFVQYQVKNAITSQKLLGGIISDSLKSHLIESLCEGASGMFLWPAMQLEHLCDRRKFKVEADIVAALKALPPTLINTFDQLYARINSYAPYAKKIATRVFSWLLAAGRSLTIPELLTAVRLDEENDDAEYTTQMDNYGVQLVLELCCNFVVLDDKSTQFSFMHASVQEYLLTLPEYSVSRYSFIVAKRCLAFFLSGEEDSDYSSCASEVSIRPDDDGTVEDGPFSPFRDYALCHWAHHLLKVRDATIQSELENVLKRFVSKDEEMTFRQWSEDVKELVASKRADASHLKELNATVNDSNSPIFMACVYGILSILENVEAEASREGRRVDFNAKNAHGASLLYISARYGRMDAVRFLLDRGARTDDPGGFFGNPLQAAAFHGHRDVVRILIERKASLLAPGKFTSALNSAMEGGNEQVIKDLLEPSNITETVELEKILLRASHDGHYEVVSHLLDLPNVNDKGKGQDGTDAAFHGTLQMALFRCRARIAKRMLKEVTNINTRSGLFGNALQAAVFGGNITMVIMVLHHGADINSPGRYGTALRAAALRGHNPIVRLLIDKGAGIEGENANALQAAASNGHLSTVSLLLDSGLYEQAKYFYTMDAVEAACFRGHMEVAKLFLRRFGSKAAGFAFSSALNGGHETIVRLALEYEAGILGSELPDGSEMLCSAGASLSLLPSKDENFTRRPRFQNEEDPGSPHAEAGMLDKAEELRSRFDGRLPLLDLDEDNTQQLVSLKNHDIGHGNGRYLRMAARNGLVTVVKDLLDKGFNINTTGNSSGPRSGQSTPIEVASAAGQVQVVELLLKRGANVGEALSYAVRNEHLEVIELLLRECPDIPVDEPVDKSRPSYFRSESAIAVAIEWNLTRILGILLDHARNTSKLAIGEGLVVAAKNGNKVFLCSILSGVELADLDHEDALVHEHYNAFVHATKRAAVNRDMVIMQLLLDHVTGEASREALLGEFLKAGILEGRWYAGLWELKTVLAPSLYEKLAGKAFIAIAAGRPSSLPKKDRSALFQEFERLSESSCMFLASHQEALWVASRRNNMDVVQLILNKPKSPSAAQAAKTSLVNQPDIHGNTALYYTCVRGSPDVFHALLEAGANAFTRHPTVPSCLISENGKALEDRKGQSNLLQIALDARLAIEKMGTAFGIWQSPLKESWGPIVSRLLDVGLEVELQSPSLVKFFYISCFQGEIEYVKKLLAKGVSLVGPSGRSDSRDFVFNSALHAATVGGQTAVAEFLISQGADVRAKADVLNWGKVRTQTVIQTALQIHLASNSAVLETCASLVRYGAAEDDAEAILHEGCRSGNLKMVRRMLQRGTRIQKPPIFNHFELYHCFVDAGYDFHSQPDFIAELQLKTMQKGDFTSFMLLIDTYGLQIEHDNLRSSIWQVMHLQENRDLFFHYFTETCSFDINAVYQTWLGSDQTATILSEAAQYSQDCDMVEFLLKEGADPESPGIPYTPLTATIAAQTSRTSHTMGSRIVRVVKTLLAHGANVDGVRRSDLEPDGRLDPRTRQTPLLFALAWPYEPEIALQLIKILVENGADVNCGRVSPLRLARFFGRHEAENLLLQHGGVDNSDHDVAIPDYAEELQTAFHGQ